MFKWIILAAGVTLLVLPDGTLQRLFGRVTGGASAPPPPLPPESYAKATQPPGRSFVLGVGAAGGSGACIAAGAAAASPVCAAGGAFAAGYGYNASRRALGSVGISSDKASAALTVAAAPVVIPTAAVYDGAKYAWDNTVGSWF